MWIRLGRATGIALLTVCAASAPAVAQELSISGDSTSTSVLQVTNTSTAQTNRVAVTGTSTSSLGYGIGGAFTGNSTGVQGFALGLNTGTQYGGYFRAKNGATNYGIYAYGAGGTGSYAGYFAGDVFVSGTITQSSDLRLKTDVRDVPSGTLDKLMRLRPKAYRYDPSTEPALGLPSEDQIGFIAQDVEKVFPVLVQRAIVPSAEGGKPDKTVLAVDYVRVVPLLVKALQEQQRQIRALEAKLDKRHKSQGR